MVNNSRGYTSLEPTTTVMECFRRTWLISTFGIVLFFLGVNLLFWNEVNRLKFTTTTKIIKCAQNVQIACLFLGTIRAKSNVPGWGPWKCGIRWSRTESEILQWREIDSSCWTDNDGRAPHRARLQHSGAGRQAEETCSNVSMDWGERVSLYRQLQLVHLAIRYLIN